MPARADHTSKRRQQCCILLQNDGSDVSNIDPDTETATFITCALEDRAFDGIAI